MNNQESWPSPLVRRGNRFEEPGIAGLRGIDAGQRAGGVGAARPKRGAGRLPRTFSDPISKARFDIGEFLHHTRRPRDLYVPSILAGQSKMQRLRVLGKEPASSRQPLHLAVHLDASTDRVAIGFGSGQRYSNRRLFGRAVVAQRPHLWPQTTLEQKIGSAVAVEVRNRECSAVVCEIKPAGSGTVLIAAVASHIE